MKETKEKKRRSPNAPATLEKVVDGTKFKFTITPRKKERASKELVVTRHEDVPEDEDFIHATEVVQEKLGIGYSGQKVLVQMPEMRHDIVIVKWNPLSGNHDYWVRIQSIDCTLLEHTAYTDRSSVWVSTRNLQKYVGQGVQVTVYSIDNETGSYSMVGSEWFVVPVHIPTDYVSENEHVRPASTRNEFSLQTKFYIGLGLAAMMIFLFVIFRTK